MESDARLEGFTPVLRVLQHVRASGVERPRLRFDLDGYPLVLRLSRAGDYVGLTRGPGRDAPYLGKIAASGLLSPSGVLRATAREEKARIWSFLQELRTDPVKAAGDAGRSVGWCCVCGRALSNPESVALGMGPICAGRMTGMNA